MRNTCKYIGKNTPSWETLTVDNVNKESESSWNVRKQVKIGKKKTDRKTDKYKNILSKVDSEKGDVVLQLTYYIVGTYTKNIHSGWIVIFNILKIGLKKKNKPINEQIKMILMQIFTLGMYKG